MLSKIENLRDLLLCSKIMSMERVFKRIIDFGLAVIGLMVTFPLLAIAGVFVKMSSSGPSIFAQTRVGRRKKPFTCYKLRTMVDGTKEVGTHEIERAALTRFGRVLRVSKLDELPQLWNVLKGEMSLVGPRPCLPSQTKLIEERSKLGVYELVPGITGIAQVEKIDMSDPVKLALKDAEYLGKQSLIFDCRLLILTIVGKGLGDRVIDRN